MKQLAAILLIATLAHGQQGDVITARHKGSPSPSGPVNKTSPVCQHTFSGSTVFTCAFNANVTSGHLLWVAAGNWTSATITVPVAPTDTCGTIYTLRGDTGNNTGNSNSRSWVWTGIAACTGPDTVSVNFGATSAGNFSIGGLEYVATTVETQSSGFTNVGNATANVSGSITTTHSNELLLVYCFEPTSDASLNVSTAGYTTEIPLGTNTTSFIASDKANIAAGSQSATCNRTISGSPEHIGLVGLY